MAILGNGALVLAFAAALFTVLTGAIGGHTQSRRYAELSRQGLFLTTGAILVASATLLYAFVTSDFSLPYVEGRSERRMPMQYIVAAFWGGQQGSLLLWLTVTATFSATAAWVNRAKLPTVMPYFHAVAMGMSAALLFVLIFVASPFDQYVVFDTPIDGSGLNPLLQNPLMVIHPPCLLSGFSSFIVPYSFAMAALLARERGSDWLKATRKWTLFSWLLLSVGNILGGMWAYQELGWGGYWAWDPVENAAIIPWFMATAYLHSVIIQEQRGMFRRWNAILVASSFVLTIVGTWMTRSGLIESVHTFAESEIGDYFFAIMVGAFAFSAYVIGSRWKMLHSDHAIESPVSREAAFMLNNWMFVGLAYVVLWGTLFPKFKEMVTGQAVAIGPAWFNKFTAPLGIGLLALMALGTLLPWRRVTGRALRRNFTIPTVATVVIVPTLLAVYWKFRGEPLGMDVMSTWGAMAIIGITLIVYNAVTIKIEFARGVRARMKSGGLGPMSAFSDLLSRHRRRYGGYLVHTGMIMIFLAFCGNVGKVERDATLRVGESIALGDYVIRFDAVNEFQGSDKREITAEMTVFRAGREIATIRPQRFDFNDYSMLAGQAADSMKITSEIAIRSTPLEDLYVALLQVDEVEQAAAFKMVVLPFTWWFWFGGIVLVAGAMVAMWPEEDKLARQYWQHRARRRFEGVIVASVLVIPTVLFVSSMEAWAQSPPPPAEEHAHEHGELTDHQEDVMHEAFSMVMTTCEGCAGKSLVTASPSCYPSNQDRDRIRAMVASGMELDQILGTFVAERGEIALAIPPAGGFNRLSWLMPVAAFGLGIGLIGMWTKRWSGAGAAAAAAAAAGPQNGAKHDAFMDELDQELAARG